MAAQSTLDRAYRTSAFPVAFVPQGDGGFRLILGGLTGTGRPYLRLYDHTRDQHDRGGLVLKSGATDQTCREQVSRLIEDTDQPNKSCWVHATMIAFSFEDARRTRGDTFRATYYRYAERTSELVATTVTGNGDREQPVVVCATAYAFNPTRVLEATHRGSQVYHDHANARRVIERAAARPHTICPKAHWHDIDDIFAAPGAPRHTMSVLKHGDGVLAF